MDLSTLGMFARLAFSLGIVIGLMWLCARVLKKRGLGGTTPRNQAAVQVELLARKPMGHRSSIAVVRVGEHAIVVGVTEQTITKLDDAEIPEIDLNEGGTTWTVPPGANGPATAWKAMLEQLRTKTTRR